MGGYGSGRREPDHQCRPRPVPSRRDAALFHLPRAIESRLRSARRYGFYLCRRCYHLVYATDRYVPRPTQRWQDQGSAWAVTPDCLAPVPPKPVRRCALRG